jgi:hypothetical protein
MFQTFRADNSNHTYNVIKSIIIQKTPYLKIWQDF